MENILVITFEGVVPEVFKSLSIENIRNDKELDLFSIRTGTIIGQFPALLETKLNVWVPIYENDTIEEVETRLTNLIKHNKSMDQRKLEDKFFGLCKDVITLAGDPRVNDIVIPKLTFDEIITLLESCEEKDFNKTVKMSLSLLSIDATLKSYNPLWWNYADYQEVV